MADVYFRDDFARLHARPDPVDRLETDGFHCVSAVRSIAGSPYQDMETPWGYGGPVAVDEAAFWRGLGLWRQRQADRGRIAEFVRLHPFLNPAALRGFLDQIRFDRVTVLVDLAEPPEIRRRHYNKGTRYSLRKAEQRLEIRPLGAEDAATFQTLYDAGLARNEATSSYYFGGAYFRDLLAADWCDAWVATLDGAPIAVACFMAGGPFAHYHLSGGDDRARDTFAHYLLLETAIEHYAGLGLRWLHLGGGRSAAPDDRLLHFKAKFSPRLIPFYTGGIVFDRTTYDALSRPETERFLSYRFTAPQAAPDLDPALRVADKSDFQAFFRLKCDIDNVVWSGSLSPPDYDHLARWFDGKIAPDSGRTILIAESLGTVIGYAYVDETADGLEITVGLAASEAQRNAFRPILRLVLKWIAENGPDRPILSWLPESNRFLAAAFTAAGFTVDETVPAATAFLAATGPDERQRCWRLTGGVEEG